MKKCIPLMNYILFEGFPFCTLAFGSEQESLHSAIHKSDNGKITILPYSNTADRQKFGQKSVNIKKGLLTFCGT